MTKNANTSADRTDSPGSGPFLTARTALVLLTAAFFGTAAGVLAYLGGTPAAGAVLAGLTAFGAAVPVLHNLIR
ncbi:hypothetical protein ACFV6F_32490 [Kitasatospora phosalacinea]|uniref:hypothetical protein n=1 Tax=Kitasatospora phosalacinea TaxID=2065 RepID=UPI00365695DC